MKMQDATATQRRYIVQRVMATEPCFASKKVILTEAYARLRQKRNLNKNKKQWHSWQLHQHWCLQQHRRILHQHRHGQCRPYRRNIVLACRRIPYLSMFIMIRLLLPHANMLQRGLPFSKLQLLGVLQREMETALPQKGGGAFTVQDLERGDTFKYSVGAASEEDWSCTPSCATGGKEQPT